MRHPENVVAIRDLARGLSDRLSVEQQRWGEDYLSHHEWGLALEMFADWLSEEEAPVSADERDVC